ncbi:MAG: DUF3738 domain-containing protein [Alphaproteobacteria bacterium]|nr:DUF3738 domain-containing protein [Alphaproteobacteria bacterium]
MPKILINNILCFLTYLTFFFPNYSQAQVNIKIGDIFPSIMENDIVYNPYNTNEFNNKYLVVQYLNLDDFANVFGFLSFNKIQNGVSNNNLIYITVCNKTSDKIKNIFDKIELNSIVVTDTKESSKIFFKDGLINSFYVLVDNKGVVKWKGESNSFNKAMIENLIHNQPILTYKFKKENKKADHEKNIKDLSDPSHEKLTWLKDNVLFDKDQLFYFSLNYSAIQDSTYKSSLNSFSNGNAKYYNLNVSLKSLLKDVTNIPEFLIEVKNSDEKRNFDVYYINNNKHNEEAYKLDLKSQILNALNLKENIEEKMMEVYNLKVIDSSKLNVSTPITNNESDGIISMTICDSNNIVAADESVQALNSLLKKRFKILVRDKTELQRKYNFIIRSRTLEQSIKDLETYGLSLEKSLELVKFYTYK